MDSDSPLFTPRHELTQLAAAARRQAEGDPSNTRLRERARALAIERDRVAYVEHVAPHKYVVGTDEFGSWAQCPPCEWTGPVRDGSGGLGVVRRDWVGHLLLGCRVYMRGA